MVDIVPGVPDSAIRGLCPLCGARVRRKWLHFLMGAGHPRVESGRCRGGHELRRVHGTVAGRWEPVDPDA